MKNGSPDVKLKTYKYERCPASSIGISGGSTRSGATSTDTTTAPPSRVNPNPPITLEIAQPPSKENLRCEHRNEKKRTLNENIISRYIHISFGGLNPQKIIETLRKPYLKIHLKIEIISRKKGPNNPTLKQKEEEELEVKEKEEEEKEEGGRGKVE